MNIENLKALVYGKETTPYQRALALSEFSKVVKALEKPTYTPYDMQSFWIWAYNNGWYYGELTEGWYHCDQMDDTKHTIDEVLKLWEATE